MTMLEKAELDRILTDWEKLTEQLMEYSKTPDAEPFSAFGARQKCLLMKAVTTRLREFSRK